jgi:hypothetical protein
VKAMDIIWDASWLCLYLLWLAADGLSAHSCNARAEYGASVGDVFGFVGAIFDGFITHHFQELGVSWVAGHGLGLACRDGILDFTLGEAFVRLADGLDHCHGRLGLHVDVREAMAHAVFLLVEGDLVAVRSGDNPVASGVVADRESVCLQLGEGEKVRDAVAYEP